MTIFPILPRKETEEALGIGALQESDNLRLCPPEKQPYVWIEREKTPAVKPGP